ncbi:hypothetical protein DFH11DRAFT_1742601 [Phellopilus nigrolimitatus]|nr:hypothetical protein DFH11DRAFT_1742601 [Phellopilus nigrolimitatus]
MSIPSGGAADAVDPAKGAVAHIGWKGEGPWTYRLLHEPHLANEFDRQTAPAPHPIGSGGCIAQLDAYRVRRAYPGGAEAEAVLRPRMRGAIAVPRGVHSGPLRTCSPPATLSRNTPHVALCSARRPPLQAPRPAIYTMHIFASAATGFQISPSRVDTLPDVGHGNAGNAVEALLQHAFGEHDARFTRIRALRVLSVVLSAVAQAGVVRLRVVDNVRAGLAAEDLEREVLRVARGASGIARRACRGGGGRVGLPELIVVDVARASAVGADEEAVVLGPIHAAHHRGVVRLADHDHLEDVVRAREALEPDGAVELDFALLVELVERLEDEVARVRLFEGIRRKRKAGVQGQSDDPEDTRQTSPTKVASFSSSYRVVGDRDGENGDSEYKEFDGEQEAEAGGKRRKRKGIVTCHAKQWPTTKVLEGRKFEDDGIAVLGLCRTTINFTSATS